MNRPDSINDRASWLKICPAPPRFVAGSSQSTLRGGSGELESGDGHLDEDRARLLPRSINLPRQSVTEPTRHTPVCRLIFWSRLAGRNDSFDPHALSRKQLREEFFLRLTRQVIKKIDHTLHPSSTRTIEPLIHGRWTMRVVETACLTPYNRPSTLGTTTTPFGKTTAKSRCRISPSVVSATATSQCTIGFCRPALRILCVQVIVKTAYRGTARAWRDPSGTNSWGSRSLSVVTM